jgi:hypothetical protein
MKMTKPQYDAAAIYAHFKQTNNKQQTATKFGVSPRTVGRVVEKMQQGSGTTSLMVVPQQQATAPVPMAENAVTEPASEIPDIFKYFVVFDGNLINITRVAVDGSEAPYSEIAYKDHKNFEKAVDLYRKGLNAEAFHAISAKHSIESVGLGFVTVHPESGRLEYDDGTTSFAFGVSLANRVIEKLTNGESVEGLLKFANFLSENPSKRAVTELYDFLVASDISITDEGLVRCYKKVRANFTDVHTGKFDNSVGTLVSIPRHLVDDDSEVTCSSGLHVCSKAYLSSFGGEVVLAVDVNPADFVSIPKDYYSINGNSVKAKARVSKYFVVADITNEI